MNLLEFLNSLSNKASAKNTALPFWKWDRWSKPRGFSRRRPVQTIPSNYSSEEFSDKNKRNDRFREIRARHSGAVKYSSVKELPKVDGKRKFESLYLVAWPRS